MTKAELIEEMAKDAGISKAAAKATAVVSEPPRPRVVMRFSGLMP